MIALNLYLLYGIHTRYIHTYISYGRYHIILLCNGHQTVVIVINLMCTYGNLNIHINATTMCLLSRHFKQAVVTSLIKKTYLAGNEVEMKIVQYQGSVSSSIQ